MFGVLIGSVCQRVTGHWYGSWRRSSEMSFPGYIMECSVCRLCRQEYVRVRCRQRDDDVAERWSADSLDALEVHKHLAGLLDRSY